MYNLILLIIMQNTLVGKAITEIMCNHWVPELTKILKNNQNYCMHTNEVEMFVAIKIKCVWWTFQLFC